MVCLVNSVTLSGKSGASSGKAEDEGVAGSYVEDENAAKGVIWLAGTHGYLEAQRIGTSGSPPPGFRITALSSSGRRSSLPLLLRLALLARMNGSLIQPAYPLSLLRDTTLVRSSQQVHTFGRTRFA